MRYALFSIALGFYVSFSYALDQSDSTQEIESQPNVIQITAQKMPLLQYTQVITTGNPVRDYKKLKKALRQAIFIKDQQAIAAIFQLQKPIKKAAS